MNQFKYRVLAFQLLLLGQLLLVDLYKPKANLAAQNINQPSSDYIKRIPDNSFYVLGPGDIISIEVVDLPTQAKELSEDARALNTVFTIDREGIANLPRLKRIYASGLTIGELTNILNKEYSVYVNDPNVMLTVVQYKPVKVYIDGEVEEPGLHVLRGAFRPSELLSEDNAEGGIDKEILEIKKRLNKSTLTSRRTVSLTNSKYFPTIIDAIRVSGGVTLNADLSDIRVTRVNSISNGGGRIKTNINLLDTLNLRDSSQNIRLLDGDTIFISRSEKPLISQISKAIASNLNPKFIDVYVGGRVEKSGPVTVNKSAVLTEAIDMSGGAKILRGPVRFLRYNSDGTIDRREFTLSRFAARGSYRNPYLRNGDVIYVGKSILNVATEVISEVTAPFKGAYDAFIFYKLIQIDQ